MTVIDLKGFFLFGTCSRGDSYAGATLGILQPITKQLKRTRKYEIKLS